MLRLTLHPDHFIDAVDTPVPQGGWLKLVMGQRGDRLPLLACEAGVVTPH